MTGSAWAVLVWLIAVAIVAPVFLFVVLILAGPHRSMLPTAVPPAVLIAGRLVFLATPVVLARTAWRRAGR